MPDANGSAGSQHALQDLAAARAAMAEATDVPALQPDEDEDGELFRVHASALGADSEAGTAAAVNMLHTGAHTADTAALQASGMLAPAMT